MGDGVDEGRPKLKNSNEEIMNMSGKRGGRKM